MKAINYIYETIIELFIISFFTLLFAIPFNYLQLAGLDLGNNFNFTWFFISLIPSLFFAIVSIDILFKTK